MGSRIPPFAKEDAPNVGAIRSDGHTTFVGAACPSCGKVRWVRRAKRTEGQTCRDCSRGNLRMPWDADRKMKALIDSGNPIDAVLDSFAKEYGLTKAAVFYRLRRMGLSYKALKEAEQLVEAGELASGHGGRCLGLARGSGTGRFRFQCKQGHPPWDAELWRLRGLKGTWCPKCGDERIGDSRRKYGPQDVDRIAASLGGFVVSAGLPVELESRIEIRCGNGHEFRIRFENLLRGQWCGTCRRRGKVAEAICRAYFEHFLGATFSPAWPDWLRGPKGAKLELDGYNEERRVAFEYHGQQHFEPMAAFKMDKEEFEARQRYDALKRAACEARGIRLIEIPFTIKTRNLGDYILGRLRESGVPLVAQDVPDFRSFRLVDDRLAQLRALAEKRGGRLISTSYVGSAVGHRWICNKDHEFVQSPYQVKAGVWCPFCAGKRRSGKDILAWARERGLMPLSTLAAVVDNDERIRVKCGLEGHTYETTARKLLLTTGCPSCARKAGGRFISAFTRAHPEVLEKARRATLGKPAHNNMVDSAMKDRIVEGAVASVPVPTLAKRLGLTRAPIYRTLRQELSKDEYRRYQERVRLLHAKGKFVVKSRTGWTPRVVVRGRSYGLGVFGTDIDANEALQEFRTSLLPFLKLPDGSFHGEAAKLASRLGGKRRPTGPSWSPEETKGIWDRLVAGARYEEVAKEHSLSVGAVKQRLNMANFSLEEIEGARFRREVETLVMGRRGRVLEERISSGRREYKLQCEFRHSPWWLRAAEIRNGRWCADCWALRRRKNGAQGTP